ncbi:unnamed protein product [Brachionus calyciflorus]|uniref:MoaB/Mog domain-containing protein n=1 Tax=Brachionus calyciflorus TaxID=104777 RepID=A0A813UC83_9BILA|nr:unnamed protein product [Brachionus calyciflorus]
MAQSGETHAKKYSVGILVVSDSCSSGVSTDKSGVNLREVINNNEHYLAENYAIVPDDIPSIKEKLIQWSDTVGLSLILTTGGTGFSPTDVTPEATREIIDKDASCLTQTILLESLKITKFATLSRAVSGIRKNTLILNLPGSKKGSQESLEIVLPVLKHALDLINDVKNDVKKDHIEIQKEPHHHQHQHHQDQHQCPHNHSKSRVSEKDMLNKPRKSLYPMISVQQAIDIIQSESTNLETESVFYMNALNRVCAEDITARDPLPPFAASVKDGFAVKLTQNQREYLQNNSIDTKFIFDVIGSSNAGDNLINMDLKEGQCVKINTGAPVPLKSDLVIQIEDTISLEKDSNNADKKIEIVSTSTCGGVHSGKIELKLGQDIRPIGFDIKIGEAVVKKGMIIRAPQIGICATVGALELKVYKQPIIGLVSTGNELMKPEEVKLNSGKIRDSNKSLLFCAAKSLGIENIFDAGIATDDPDTVFKVFKNAFENSDVIISTGGVSMGDKDLVKDVLEKDFGCKIHFARMNMKPGKPTTFATCEFNGRKKLIFALPGNPVSAIVTFNLVVVPCLKKLMGYTNPFFTEIKVRSEFDAELDPRPEYHRCWLQWPKLENQIEFEYPKAYSTGNQHSSRLLSMNEANVLVILPGRTEAKTRVTKGEILTALLIDKI